MKLTIKVSDQENGKYKADAELIGETGGRWTFFKIADTPQDALLYAIYEITGTESGLNSDQTEKLFALTKSLKK